MSTQLSLTSARRVLQTEFSAVMVFYHTGYCCIGTYAAVFLQHRGYSNTLTGLISALAYIGGFLLALLLAARIDQSRKITVFHCLFGLLILEIAMEGLLILSRGSTVFVAVIFVLLMACAVAASPLNTELSFRMGRHGARVNFGQARALGSLAFSILTIQIGKICANRSPEYMSHLSILLILLQMSVLFVILRMQKRLPTEEVAQAVKKESGVSLISFVTLNKRFMLFCLGNCILLFAPSMLGCFLINVAENIGGSAGSVGIVTFIAAISEVPAMLLYKRIAKKVKCSSIICFAAIGYVLRMLTSAWAESLGMLYFSACFQMLSYALLVPALVEYAGRVVDRKDSAKAQAISASVFTVANVIASYCGGLMLDHMSVHKALVLSFVICVIGAGICFMTVDRKRA